MSLRRRNLAKPSKRLQEFNENFKTKVERAASYSKDLEDLFNDYGNRTLPRDDLYQQIQREIQEKEKQNLKKAGKKILPKVSNLTQEAKERSH